MKPNKELVVTAKLTLLTTEAGGRHGYILESYRPTMYKSNQASDIFITHIKEERIYPGETGEIEMKIMWPHLISDITLGDTFVLKEGRRIVATGIVVGLGNF